MARGREGGGFGPSKNFRFFKRTRGNFAKLVNWVEYGGIAKGAALSF